MQLFSKTTLIMLLLLGLSALSGAWWWQARTGTKPAWRTAPIQRGDVAATISASGTIEPEEVVDVGAQVAGLIQSFGTDIDGKTIDYSSVVAEGAVLAKIDDSVYVAALNVAQAQVEQAKAGELSAGANADQMRAKLVQTEAEWKRAKELTKDQLMAQVDFDTDEANYQVAKANVAVADAAVAQAKAATVQAQAGLAGAQRNLDFCVIKSPVRGVIIDRRVNIGQTVVASLNAPSLFLIARDLTRMQIWVSVNEADVGRITPGAPVTFTCDTFPGREFAGTVGRVRLNATMTQNVVMYTVEVNTANPDHLLLPYLTANVHFVVRQESGVLLAPNAALRWSPASPAEIAPDARNQNPANALPPDVKNDGRPGVLWVHDGAFVRPLAVTTGTSDGANTAVTANGLQAGQEVVVGEMTDGKTAGTQNPFLPPVIKR